ncbi:MAG: pyruvate, phosphate dikinase [Gemmatimonadota bacterium]|nr:pyruvate, phosphate dikinase [Gemmatimonadota bacterium]
MTDGRMVFNFGQGRADGTAAMKDILGGKGAGLAEMTNIGIPVPPGFTISASLCASWLESRTLHPQLRRQVDVALQRIESISGRVFGDAQRPLLVSVRSGSAVSMPGMMETILNLGLNDTTVAALSRESGNPGFAHDTYRRFVQMYGSVVYEVPKAAFEERLTAARTARGVSRDIDLPAADLLALAHAYKEIVAARSGHPFPDDPRDQLWGAIEAVFESWNTRRAQDYRKLHEIPDTLGTAVNVMAMVFGNMGEDSGTGVVFTRDPSTGERTLYGEFLLNAQGEDVVSGARTPLPIDQLQAAMPGVYTDLERVAQTLERHFRDVQDLEFTIERGHLYLLQTRRAQRSGHAAVRIACEMVDEGVISSEEAVARVPPKDLEQLLHPTIDPKAELDLLTTGLPASPGAASGIVVFDADTAESRGRQGEAVILVRRETSPEDFHGMVQAKAILTARGGMTSHAAVVARGMGTPCVAGAHELDIREDDGHLIVSGRMVTTGDWITVDGTSGRVYLGKTQLIPAELTDNFAKLLGWADKTRHLRVRVNADTPADAHRGRDFGAEGIGLCRTEHMFFQGDRIHAMREMILAQDTAGRQRALAKLLPMQRADFEGIFRAMEGFPVTIRLLDPPLHEFLPKGRDEIEVVAQDMGRDPDEVARIVADLSEVNPMLGLRGCRLGIIYPEVTAMQVRAIFEAACIVASRKGRVMPEVMIPLVAHVVEFRRQALVVRQVAEEVFRERQMTVPYLLGTMIELPRAALTADEIAREAQFFSFGTNDLTQTTWGLSRDDAGRFLPQYLELGIIENDPFMVLDEGGVGRLVAMAVELGRGTRPDLKIGICGEHGGEPRAIAFCEAQKMNYVSCSPFRVPIARLAAGQAALAERGTMDRTRATV